VPYAKWLRTDMKGWLHDILLDRKTLARGYFRRDGVEQLISEDQRSGGYSKELFTLAVLELWHRAFLDKTTSPSGGAESEPSLATAG
jgi:asparagine synthase (glutamine-hydrolysing)